jgi:hypothetical protein
MWHAFGLPSTLDTVAHGDVLPCDCDVCCHAAADAVDGEALASELAAQHTESDKAGLRLFNAYLKAGRQGRALEMVGVLHNIRSIEGEQRHSSSNSR